MPSCLGDAEREMPQQDAKRWRHVDLRRVALGICHKAIASCGGAKREIFRGSFLLRHWSWGAGSRHHLPMTLTTDVDVSKKSEVRIGPFVLLDELASGAMARVFRARYRPREGERGQVDLDPGAVVVVKVIRNPAETTPALMEAFQKEAELLVLLDHPAITRALTRGITHGRVWVAMEYVEGESFAHVLEAFGQAKYRLKPEVALTLLSDVCEGLAAAHALVDPRGQSLGLVHGDVSPHNLLLDIQGYGRIIDFGCAHLSAREPAPQHVWGTPGYLSPEQARMEPPTQASDVYSLGLILFEMLTGLRAYPVENLPDAVVLGTHAEGRRTRWPDVLDVPERVRLVVEQALQADPAHRPQNAAEMFHLISPLVKEPGKSRRALSIVARDLVKSNAERVAPLFV